MISTLDKEELNQIFVILGFENYKKLLIQKVDQNLLLMSKMKNC